MTYKMKKLVKIRRNSCFNFHNVVYYSYANGGKRPKGQGTGEKIMQTAAYEMDQVMEIAGKMANRCYLTEADKEDMAQEIAIAIWQAGEKADTEKNVKAYQFTTGKGIALNTFNQIILDQNTCMTILNSPVTDLDGDGVEMVDTIANGLPGYIDSEIASEKTIAIDKAIGHLPENEQEIVRGYMDGKYLSDIAQKKGYTRERARQVFESAKEKLAFYLKDWQDTIG